MTVEVIYLDEHEVNKVAGMLSEISSLEEQKEVAEMKKEKTSDTLDSFVTKLFAGSNEEYKESLEKQKENVDWDSPWNINAPPPTISDDLKSLVLLPNEKGNEDPVPIVYLNSEESKRIAGLKGEIRSLGEQSNLASQHADIKELELRKCVEAIAEERSETYQEYCRKSRSGHKDKYDIRPILTDDGKAIVIRNFGPASPRSMF